MSSHGLISPTVQLSTFEAVEIVEDVLLHGASRRLSHSISPRRGRNVQSISGLQRRHLGALDASYLYLFPPRPGCSCANQRQSYNGKKSRREKNNKKNAGHNDQ